MGEDELLSASSRQNDAVKLHVDVETNRSKCQKIVNTNINATKTSVII